MENQDTILKDKIFEFLDELRESGQTNMLGVVPYIVREFPALSKVEAKEWLLKWMKSFQAD